MKNIRRTVGPGGRPSLEFFGRRERGKVVQDRGTAVFPAIDPVAGRRMYGIAPEVREGSIVSHFACRVSAEVHPLAIRPPSLNDLPVFSLECREF